MKQINFSAFLAMGFFALYPGDNRPLGIAPGGPPFQSVGSPLSTTG